MLYTYLDIRGDNKENLSKFLQKVLLKYNTKSYIILPNLLFLRRFLRFYINYYYNHITL